jgi:hypothetical protein
MILGGLVAEAMGWICSRFKLSFYKLVKSPCKSLLSIIYIYIKEF